MPPNISGFFTERLISSAGKGSSWMFVRVSNILPRNYCATLVWCKWRNRLIVLHHKWWHWTAAGTYNTRAQKGLLNWPHLIIRSCLSDLVSRLSQNSPHPIHPRLFGHPTILTFTMSHPPARITSYIIIIVTSVIIYPKREPEQNTIINKNAKSSEAGPKHPKNCEIRVPSQGCKVTKESYYIKWPKLSIVSMKWIILMSQNEGLECRLNQSSGQSCPSRFKIGATDYCWVRTIANVLKTCQ